MVDDRASGNHHIYVAERTQIIQRILRSDDQIGCFPLFNRSRDITDSGKFGASPGRRIECKCIRDTYVFVEVIKFTPEIVLRDPRAADIIAKYNRDIVCQCLLGAIYDSFEYDIAIKLLNFGRICDRAVEERIWQSR